MPTTDKTLINMHDLLACLTNAGDLISHEVADHHQQVAYLAFRIAEQMNLPAEQKKNLALAGLLHDVGAFSLDERLELIENEPAYGPRSRLQGGRGCSRVFSPCAPRAEIIRYHHMPWAWGEGQGSMAAKRFPI
jgi:response regulator RpfG family c-di-GMP phosphodiesterase